MESWAPVAVPQLPGRGVPLRLHDTAGGGLRPLAPGDPLRMYVCGITPYDATHLGHAATYLAFDLLQRVALDGGHRVRYVQNVTDVDDPLLERAVATGMDWQQIAARETALFRRDMTDLRVLPPDAYVGAVEAIPLVAEYVERLRADGHVYEVEGDLYFPVHDDPSFGAVSGLPVEEMLELFGERGGDPARPGKKHALDCLLWQQARPEEPAWETSLGHGRPGWHVECSAIALEHLGDRIDVQGGGRDLVFPHHEMSTSIAQVATDLAPFARHYVHAGLVGLDGEKMSKSRGNLVFVRRLLDDGTDPMALRLALLAHHYREDWAWTEADLPAAEERLARWRAAVAAPTGPAAQDVLDTMRRRLADDLATGPAVAAVDRWADEVRLGRGEDADAPHLVRNAVDALLGVVL